MSEPLVSICIPTFRRGEIMRQMLDSIFSQKVNPDLFEVCISDNSDNDEIELLIKEYEGHSNLVYHRATCEGFLNSIEVLKLGKGKLLKLLNNYSIFRSGQLEKLIYNIDQHQDERPLVFFAMGKLEQNELCQSFADFNGFLKCIGMKSSWSSAPSVWRQDFENLMETDFVPDKMFPHTSIIFEYTDKEKYVVDNNRYTEDLIPDRKGGYNLPDTFINHYLKMVRNLYDNSKINKDTYAAIEKEVVKFVAAWQWLQWSDKNRYQYDFSQCKEIVASLGSEAYKVYKKQYYRSGIERIVKKITFYEKICSQKKSGKRYE